MKLKKMDTEYSRKFLDIENKLSECKNIGIKIQDIRHKKFDITEALSSRQVKDFTPHNSLKKVLQTSGPYSEGFKINNDSKNATNDTKKEIKIENSLDEHHISFDKIGEKDSFKQKNPLRRGITGLTDTVAFMAILSSSVDNLSNGYIIAFPTVLLNEANAYSGSDGIFICPQSGLYMFSYNIFLGAHTGKVAFCGVQFKVNGHPYYESYESSFDEQEVENVGATFVVRLNIGDHVWIASDKSGTQLFAKKTYFMGVLLVE